MPLIEADVDGKRIRVTAQDEIVLQCGSALHHVAPKRRVVIRGTACGDAVGGTNRIKGDRSGSIELHGLGQEYVSCTAHPTLPRPRREPR